MIGKENRKKQRRKTNDEKRNGKHKFKIKEDIAMKKRKIDSKKKEKNKEKKQTHIAKRNTFTDKAKRTHVRKSGL